MIDIVCSGTCEGCLTYARTLRQLRDDSENGENGENGPISRSAQRAFDLMRTAHHKKNITTSRREHFRQLMANNHLSPDLIQMYYDLALPVLASEIVTSQLFTATYSNTRAMGMLLKLTGGYCLCGCNQAISKRSMFRRGHDSRFLGWVRLIEQGKMQLSDPRIPDRARQALAVLPRCVCCGGPVMRGSNTERGWMGEWCAKGRCSCRERERAKIEAADRIRNRTAKSIDKVDSR